MYKVISISKVLTISSFICWSQGEKKKAMKPVRVQGKTVLLCHVIKNVEGKWLVFLYEVYVQCEQDSTNPYSMKFYTNFAQEFYSNCRAPES